MNQEAASLDWTRSRSHTLNGVQYSGHYEDDNYIGDSSNPPQKLGGSTMDQLANARASSVAAAYRRLSNASVNSWGGSVVSEESNPDDSGLHTNGEPASMDSMENENLNINIRSPNEAQRKPVSEPDPDDLSGDQNKLEPDSCDSQYGETMESEFYPEFTGNGTAFGQDFSNYVPIHPLLPSETNRKLGGTKLHEVPDPDKHQGMEILDSGIQSRKDIDEPDHDDSQENRAAVQTEPDPDDNLGQAFGVSSMQTYEPDPDDQELQRIQDPVTFLCSRLQKAIEMLQVEVTPLEATSVLQTLSKIIRYTWQINDAMFSSFLLPVGHKFSYLVVTEQCFNYVDVLAGM